MAYAVNLELEGRKAVVIGGGKVAEQKIKGLISANATVTVVSPVLTEPLMWLVIDQKITWHKKLFTGDDLEGAFIIIAATNDRATNLMVKNLAAPHQLVNIVDQPASSDFQVPSVLKRGKLSIAISSSGASPVLAKNIRKELEVLFDQRYESYLEFLADRRMFILNHVEDPKRKKELLTAIADKKFLESENREEEFLELWNLNKEEADSKG